MRQYLPDHNLIINDDDYMHSTLALGAGERMHLISFLNQLRPVSPKILVGQLWQGSYHLQTDGQLFPRSYPALLIVRLYIF